MEWITARSVLIEGFNTDLLWDGFRYYAFPFLTFLTCHEFGHYFMAKRRHVSVTLPYYIPLWIPIMLTFGTMGAFIRIKDVIKDRINYFDIGIAGPLAGFVVALGFLVYGYSHLPAIDYVFQIHPEYQQYGEAYGDFVYQGMNTDGMMRLGDSLLSGWIRETFADPARIPHINELTHYPFILAGFLGLFFTALNLMPIGQLDGGHILFSLIGEKWFNRVSPVLFGGFVFYAGLGFFTVDELQNALSMGEYQTGLNFLIYVYVVYLCFSRVTPSRQSNWIIALTIVFVQLLANRLFPFLVGYSGFLAFAFLLGRLLGIYHPPVSDSRSLGTGRVVLGWISLLIFVLCFSPSPFY